MKRVRVTQHVDILTNRLTPIVLRKPPTHPHHQVHLPMPSEHIVSTAVDQLQPDQQQGQVKVCSSCHSTLSDTTSSVFLPEADAIVCAGCREHVLSGRGTMISTETRTLCVDLDNDFVRQLSQEGNALHNTRPMSDDSFDEDTDMESPISPDSDHLFHGTLVTPPPYTIKHVPLNVQCTNNSFSKLPHHQNHGSYSHIHAPSSSRRHGNATSSPDPLIDITRLRVRSHGHHCLYPGASFQGTQKSGRNSYDVNVTIVVCCPFK
jgi:hypothetical protein